MPEPSVERKRPAWEQAVATLWSGTRSRGVAWTSDASMPASDASTAPGPCTATLQPNIFDSENQISSISSGVPMIIVTGATAATARSHRPEDVRVRSLPSALILGRRASGGRGIRGDGANEGHTGRVATRACAHRRRGGPSLSLIDLWRAGSWAPRSTGHDATRRAETFRGVHVLPVDEV